ncbi:hypothetical protein BKA69DRAFT_1064261 [Paraphysoderma sedebokerense]|nr:hypothetical protein BKA69DRAFT_1064261 [Paraphysoderma sedebokerense]
MSSHKQVTMVLIKPSFANYFALWTIFFDAVAYVTLILISAKGRFIFDLGPLWKFLRSLGIGVPYGWYHVLGFVVVAIWLFYASIFVRQSLVQSLQRKSTFILLPGTILLPFIATIGFVPVARILLAYVNCKYTKNLAFFDDDCTQRCFTDPHYVWLAVAIVMLALFIPFVMYFSGVWQELQENLDIKYQCLPPISIYF